MLRISIYENNYYKNMFKERRFIFDVAKGIEASSVDLHSEQLTGASLLLAKLEKGEREPDKRTVSFGREEAKSRSWRKDQTKGKTLS